MQQHSPIKKDFAQTTHGIRKKDIHKRDRSGHTTIIARQQPRASWIDQFKTSLKHNDKGPPQPSIRANRQENIDKHHTIKGEDGPNGTSP
jgi:hypothetical protein